MTVFNQNNRCFETGFYPLFLGEGLGVLDTVNKTYPILWDLYKLQKSVDWDENENEKSLEQSRMDLLNCSKNNYDIMIKNLAYQTELDAIASRSIAPLLAPFITNPELWVGLSKISEIENLHAITYSHIGQQCFQNPNDIFDEVVNNENVTYRSAKVIEVFDELKKMSAMFSLGLLEKTDPKVRRTLIKSIVALYCLERIEFMGSFAATFILAEQGIFQGIAKLVQKIAQDEQIHYKFDEAVISILLHEGWKPDFIVMANELQQLVDEIVKQEIVWNKYLFSEGRTIVGLNEELLNQWTKFNAQAVYKFLDLSNPYDNIDTNPLPWMEEWLDIDSVQNANMEADNNNYALNVVKDDLGDDTLDFDL